MRNLTRSESIGLMALLTIITGIVGFASVRAGLSAASPGITLHEAFPQAPAAPPPIRPSDSIASAANGNVKVPAAADSAGVDTPGEVVVHVAGAVKHPGVYHLPVGVRNDDAVLAAGGATSKANTDAINLAARVEDGSQLYIPTREEQPSGGAATEAPPSMTSAAKHGGKKAVHAAGNHQGRGGKADKLTDPSQGKINLNTADAEQLQRLPGVGPAMAARLIAFRTENHGFHSIEDLLQVTGIGEKKFAKLQPFVTVGSVAEVGHKKK